MPLKVWQIYINDIIYHYRELKIYIAPLYQEDTEALRRYRCANIMMNSEF